MCIAISFLSSPSDARPSANPEPSPNPEPFIQPFLSNLFRRLTGKSKSRPARPRQIAQSPPGNSYGGPTLPTYGGPRPQGPAQGIGSAPGPTQLNYGPQLPTGASAAAGNNYAAAAPALDSYGSPSAAPLGGGGDIDSYGSPSAPAIAAGGNQDSYGSPSAPVVPTYGISGSGNTPNIVPAPAPVPAPSSAGDSYGSPSAPPIASAPKPSCEATRSLTDTGNCQQGGQVLLTNITLIQ